MTSWNRPRTILFAAALTVGPLALGCTASTDDGSATDGDGTAAENPEGNSVDDGAQDHDPPRMTSEELLHDTCSVHVMYPKIGHTGVSVASNAWGNCWRAHHSYLHFMMRTKGILGWHTVWDFRKDVPYTGSYNLEGRQASLAAVSEVYVEATVCWKESFWHCRSDNAWLKNLN